MLRLHLNLHPLHSLVGLLMLGCIFSIVHAAPVVNGNTISWPDDGWYQVQRADDYRSLCEGGRACDVPDGKYIVINHSTGERFTDIQVDGTGAVDLPPLLAATVRAVLYPGAGGELFWARASDDKGVVGYEVTRNGQVMGLFDALSYYQPQLVQGSEFRFSVTAIGGLVAVLLAQIPISAGPLLTLV